MPKININNCSYHYEIHGDGPETIVFSHGLLFSSKMFDQQVDFLKSAYKVVTYDHRGQGQSEVTENGYGMDDLYEDAVALIEKLELGPVHFAGLSMGGFVALRLAARRPDLIKSIVLMETSAEPEPNKIKYSLLKSIVNIFGVASVKGPVMKIMFGDKFLTDPSRREALETWTSELLKNKKTITRAVDGVIRRDGVEEELKNIHCPALILVGTQDKATVPAKAEFIHQRIEHSVLKYIEGAGHSSSVEEPAQVNAAIREHLFNCAKASPVSA